MSAPRLQWGDVGAGWREGCLACAHGGGEAAGAAEFHLTTAAYRRFVQANDLQAAVVEAANGAVADVPASLERASATIQGLFRRGAMPEEVAAAIRRADAGLGEGEPAEG